MREFKEAAFFQPDTSITSLDYTYAFSKYSCVSWVYPLHIIFAYLVVLSGFLAIISRVIPKLTPYHTTFGMWYFIWMFWCMASSVLIHNAGLPMPIIVCVFPLHAFQYQYWMECYQNSYKEIPKSTSTENRQQIKSTTYLAPPTVTAKSAR